VRPLSTVVPDEVGVDQQTLKLQEAPERVPHGRNAAVRPGRGRTILVDVAPPGTRGRSCAFPLFGTAFRITGQTRRDGQIGLSCVEACRK
jgi:hypothetical protein